MHKRKFVFIYSSSILFLLIQLSCDTSDTFISSMNKLDCESRGGKWYSEVKSNGDIEEWCGHPEKLESQEKTEIINKITPSSDIACDAYNEIIIENKFIDDYEEWDGRHCSNTVYITNKSDKKIMVSVHVKKFKNDAEERQPYWTP